MMIQVLKDVVLPNGMTVKAGGVLEVANYIGAALIEQGKARPRPPQEPTERKGGPVYGPGDELPPVEPHVRVPAPPAPHSAFESGALEDQDNFVRDLVTYKGTSGAIPSDSWPDGGNTAPPVTPSESAEDREPLLTLDEIKIHCHIEPDITDEDALLELYERAARLNTENYLRYQVDATVGENIKHACLMLIAHWYRNREAVTTGRGSVGEPMPFGYRELLNMERDYPVY